MGDGLKTIVVVAEVPVLGLRRGAHVELTDSEFLRRVLAHGWLTRVRKSDPADPEPRSDASSVPAGTLEQEAAAAADAAAAVEQAVERA